MIQQKSRLRVADNTGAKELLCIRVLAGSVVTQALSDVIVATVKDAILVETSRRVRSSRPSSSARRNVAVRTVLHQVRRERCCCSRKLANLDGTRIFRTVGRELRDKKFMKIIRLPGRCCDNEPEGTQG